MSKGERPDKTGAVYELIAAAQKGDRQAKEQLVMENTGLVNMAARKFSGSGLEFEDLMQIGFIGLIKAIDRFDESFGVMFSTYAVPMIVGEIRRFLRDEGKVKISRQLKQDVKILKEKEEEFIHLNDRSPRVSELAEMMGRSVEETVQIIEAKNVMSGIASIDDENFVPAQDTLISDESEAKNAELIDLKDGIGSLGEQERQVIVFRYFEDMTQQQTGDRLGISQVQVSRIEKKVLAALRNRMC